MRAAWLVSLGVLLAVVAVMGVAEDSVLESEAVGSVASVERTISPQTVSISTDTVKVESWQAQSSATRHDLEPMPQNAHAITSSQTQIHLKTWSVPILHGDAPFAVDDSTGDIYAVVNNKVQMIDVSENTRTEWIIPEDRVASKISRTNDGSVVVNGKYWFVDSDGKIHRLDPSTGVFTVWDTKCVTYMPALLDSGQGNIWCVGTYYYYARFLIKLDPEQNEVTNVSVLNIQLSPNRNDPLLANSSSGIFTSGYGADNDLRLIQIAPTLDSAKVWNIHEDRADVSDAYVAGDKVYFMKHFPNRQVLGEFDTVADTLSEWSLPYQTASHVTWTSIVVNSNGIVFFEMSGAESELHRLVLETAEFTKFNIRPSHLVIDSSDTIYLNLGSAVAAAT